MHRLAKQLLISVAALAVLAYLGLCGYMYVEQRHNIFLPVPDMLTTPERIGMQYEEVHIPSGSGSERGELYGWWIPAERADAPTILYLHGNDMNISHVQDIAHASRLHRMGYNLLMIDYRGYGKSTGGEPSETKVYEDAESAWDYLTKRIDAMPRAGASKPGSVLRRTSAKQQAGASRRVFIYGHSLGGAIAIELASHHPEAAGLIVESTFTSMAEMGKREYGYLPVTWLLNQYFDSLDKVSKLKIPVLYIHGTMDTLVPYTMSERLYEKTPQPRYLTLIKGGGHGNSGLVGWVEYRDAFSGFIKRYTH